MSTPIRIVTGYDQAMSVIGALSRDAWFEYAFAMGYQFEATHRLGAGLKRPASWGKLGMIHQGIRAGCITVWADADSIPWAPLRAESLLESAPASASILVASDPYGLCCSHIIVRPTTWAVKFLPAWYVMGDSDGWQRYHTSPKWEQDALKLMMEFFPEIRNRVFVMPGHVVCQSGEPTDSHWAVHASGNDMTMRIARLRRLRGLRAAAP